MTTPSDLFDDLALVFRQPEPVPARPRRMLLLLHGVGGNEMQLAKLGAQVGDDTLVVLPCAPIALAEAMFGWFRVAFTAQGPRIEPEEAEASRLRLLDFI